jgi:Beta-galactosidase
VKHTFFIIFLLSLSFVSFSQWKQKEFVIGTFADPRISPDNNFKKDSLSFALAKNAHINLLTGPQYYMGSKDFSMMDRTLKLAEKFDMKLLVIDSRMRIIDSSFNEDTALKIISHFKSLNSKAFAGYYLIGEVPQKYAAQVKKWASFFKKNDPDKLAYYYLLPRYAFNSRKEYEDYLNSLLGGDVVAYDCYPFSKNGTLVNSYFYNLNIIRKKAGDTPIWCYVLSTSTPNYSDPTDYQLYFSAFCPIAYGAKGIIYFTYETIPEKYGGKFGDAIIDKNGNPTRKYQTVKNIDEYISKVIGPVVMSSKNVGVYNVSENSDNNQQSNSNFIPVKIDNASILAGEFKSNVTSARYLLLVNKANAAINNLNIALSGNFVNTLEQFPRINQMNANLAPEKINAKSVSGQTTFEVNRIMPGEAILLQF